MIKNNKKEILITERLILRKFRSDDSEAMFNNWTNDKEVAKYTAWVEHKSVDVTKYLVDMWLEAYKDEKTERFIITLKGNDEPVGMIDIAHFNDDIPEVGYCLSRKCWGKGYMTEACRAFVNYLFELGYPKILIRADKRNIGSNRVIEKCGFVFTHEEKMEHCSELKPDSITVKWYEIIL